MTLVLLLVTVAHQGYRSASGKMLKQSQRKFLGVILDCWVPLVEAVAFYNFAKITPFELRPADFSAAP